MEDRHIVELYLQRNERAIAETHTKYGRYCHYIAYNILSSNEDAEEIVNDTYLKVWNRIPPQPFPLPSRAVSHGRQYQEHPRSPNGIAHRNTVPQSKLHCHRHRGNSQNLP